MPSLMAMLGLNIQPFKESAAQSVGLAEKTGLQIKSALSEPVNAALRGMAPEAKAKAAEDREDRHTHPCGWLMLAE